MTPATLRTLGLSVVTVGFFFFWIFWLAFSDGYVRAGAIAEGRDPDTAGVVSAIVVTGCTGGAYLCVLTVLALVSVIIGRRA